MKKILLIVVILAVAAFAAYKIFLPKPGENGAGVQPVEQKPLTVSKNSEAFNSSFEKMLTGYFSLKEALADYDTTRANIAAKQLAGFADSLKTDEIKGDSTGAVKQTAKDFAGTIIGSAKGLQGETDLTKKKREFSMISEALYNLVRTVRYDRQKLYHQHCPMAFNDSEEAWWISTSNKIDNPYLGRKHPKYKGTMTECGDITDSLDFSK